MGTWWCMKRTWWRRGGLLEEWEEGRAGAVLSREELLGWLGKSVRRWSIITKVTITITMNPDNNND